MNLYQELEKEKERLKQIAQEVKKSEKTMPQGKLRIANRKDGIEYYHVLEGYSAKKENGHYIRKTNMPLVEALAQKDYDDKLLRGIDKRIKVIDEFYEKLRSTDLSKLYESLSEIRKTLVDSRVEMDEKFIKAWKEKMYIGKPFMEGTSEIYTNNGERVRSKSEKIIADTLSKYNIPYHYEKPIVVKGMGMVYPDFTILHKGQRKEVYWEHFGMMDNVDYCEQALRKIEHYQRNKIMLGKDLIITYETSKTPLETTAIERTIKEYLLE